MRVGPGLWPRLRAVQVYGANTNVGKTLVSTLLVKAARERRNWRTWYLKPVSTGPLDEADNSHIARHAPTVPSRTLFQFRTPVSPHLAVRLESTSLGDAPILSGVHAELTRYAAAGPGFALVETAGGVLSPAPSGSLQADVYRPLRLPVLLVADHALGGIATSISAFESLHVRGYDVTSVVLIQDEEYRNAEYLTEYFADRGIATTGIPPPPARLPDSNSDAESLGKYYEQVSASPAIDGVLQGIEDEHEARLARLGTMAEEAHKSIWYPFTQHQGRKAEDILVIDSAYGDDFAALTPTAAPSLLQPTFDGSASWWTQGLGHGSPALSLAAAHAAGRYGHVMFAGAVHEPALALAQLLLTHHANPRLSRVFYTDNGSAGMEVAVKMGLRAACARYGWDHTAKKVEILGLKGGYHGDTMGVMDAAEPSTYNARVEWYTPRGYWFEFPQVKMRDGKWVVESPAGLEGIFGPPREFGSLGEVFELQTRDASAYEKYITATLKDLRDQSRTFGALVLEPVVLGAGGMYFADPLFQHALINTIRRNPTLISATAPPPTSDPEDWTGLPIIFDEIFTGLYRLGHFNTSALLQAEPDIIANAKLLTGGLVPLCTTAASESIFEAFLSADKASALLHGHSYTAHAVGCAVAVESVKMLMGLERTWGGYREDWGGGKVWSMWSRGFVEQVSRLKRVDYAAAMGSVFVVALKDEEGAGYNSNASADVQRRLMEGTGGYRIHNRVLGNVLYLMASETSTPDTLAEVQRCLLEALEA
ncbi:onanonoxo-7-onima-8-eninoihtemlysoneda [Trichodelitschia bisporula]|uniref:Onanonoxo-7-onima-8-eninoihtemlysoneda n=1 Tax=Trichodelitschia bisporula TaxID=703511 RepID=A0A6G1I9T9_9PEZI|nr:onanonoxo-7-onima-8-eninoihtemlysoneda [Trichodelitschia bisporula]